MPSLKITTSKKLLKFLEKNDFQKIRQTGSHAFLQKGDLTTVIPLHNKDMGRGITRKILRDTDIAVENYNSHI